jgi:hypothetical protein
MSEQKKHVLVEVSTYSEWVNGATFAIVPPEAYEMAKAYYKELKRMNEAGLSPYRITEFNGCVYWLKELPAISPELAKQLDVVVDESCELDYHLEEAYDEQKPYVSTIEELCHWEDNDPDSLRVECSTLNVYEDTFSFKAVVKHTDVGMETRQLDSENLAPTPLIENEFYVELDKTLTRFASVRGLEEV